MYVFTFTQLSQVPALLAKACEMFVEELTLCAWIHTDDAKRKTLQRNDVASVIGSYEHLDFLIDILQKEEPPRKRGRPSSYESEATVAVPSSGATTEVQYVLQQGPDGVTHLVPVSQMTSSGGAIG